MRAVLLAVFCALEPLQREAGRQKVNRAGVRRQQVDRASAAAWRWAVAQPAAALESRGRRTARLQSYRVIAARTFGRRKPLFLRLGEAPGFSRAHGPDRRKRGELALQEACRCVECCSRWCPLNPAVHRRPRRVAAPRRALRAMRLLCGSLLATQPAVKEEYTTGNSILFLHW